jgi:hypothetical protein
MARNLKPSKLHHVPGLYASLLNAEQREHDRPDPRLSYDADRVTKALLVAAAKAAPDGPKFAALKAGERVRVPSGSLRGRTFGDAVSHIDWLADPYSEIRELWAHSDDTVTPAEPHPNALA